MLAEGVETAEELAFLNTGGGAKKFKAISSENLNRLKSCHSTPGRALPVESHAAKRRLRPVAGSGKRSSMVERRR